MRAVVRTVARTLGGELLLFCVVDEHVHAVLAVVDGQASRRGAALAKALDWVIRADLARPHVSDVDGRGHLDHLVTYFIRQSVKHGLPGHPASWTGSCLGDLVGVRVTAGFTREALKAALPRLTMDSVLRRVELDRSAIEPADDDQLFAAGPVAVVGAAADALAVMPDERSGTAVIARRAAVHLLAGVGYSTAVLARATDMKPRSIRSLLAQDTAVEVLELVRRRVTFDDAVAAAPPVALTDREQEALRRSRFR